MALNPDEIAPLDGASAPAAPASTEDSGAELPDEILKIPAFQGILEGRPAAVYDHKGSGNAVLDAIPKNVKALSDAGIQFYPSKDGTLFVMYNTAFLSPEDVEKADSDGKLTEIAEPLGAVMGAYESVLSEGSAAPASEAAPAPAPTSSVPASTEKKLTTARLTNLSPGSPTSGPAPGAGRVFNSVIKRAV